MKLFSNLSIKARIIIMAGTLMLATLTLTGTGISSLTSIGSEVHDITTNDMPLTKKLSTITEHQLEQSILMEKTLRYGNVLASEKIAKAGYQKAVEEFEELAKKVDSELVEAEHIAQQGLNNAHNEIELAEYSALLKKIKELEVSHSIFDKHVEDIFHLVDAGKLHEASIIAEKVEKEETKLNHAMNELLIEIERFTEEAMQTIEEHEQQAISMMAVVTIVGMIIGTLMSITVITSVVRGLNKAVAASQRIAQGDLTQDLEAHSTDEIGKLITAMHDMQESLKQVLTEMNQSSTELAAASEELASVSEETSRNTHTQQSEIDQMATAMEEMAATVQEVAQNANSTSEAALHANDEAAQGENTVKETAKAIEKLATSVADAAQLLETLERNSESIGSVLDVIKSVAEQTNLLALNAAIEAARAGEQGRGFAVVADEVRVLAQRTQESTEEIEQMIARVQSGTASAVTAMNVSRELASSGVQYAHDCGKALAKITGVVSQITSMNQQIAVAAEEQARVAEEVNSSVNTISGIGQQNAAAANQTSSSSQELSQMAINLQELICKFKV